MDGVDGAPLSHLHPGATRGSVHPRRVQWVWWEEECDELRLNVMDEAPSTCITKCLEVGRNPLITWRNDKLVEAI